MNNDLLYDKRYPFNSLSDFLSGGYLFDPLALHLTLGLFCSFFLIFKILQKKTYSLAFRCSLIFFVLYIFNNYAYQLLFYISEWFGVFAVIFSLFKRKMKLNYISIFLIVFSAIALIHLSIISIIYPELESEFNFGRIAVVLKVLILALNLAIIYSEIKLKEDIDYIFNHFYTVVVIVAFCYFVQIFVFVFYALPYGSFSPAGWTASILPSFASVSIERGHLGKFLVPLFPIILYGLLIHKKYFVSVLFLTISLINVSASSYVFFAWYMSLTIMFFWREIGVKKLTLLALIMIGAAIAMQNLLLGMINKVFDFAIVQDAEGGRSFSLIEPILNNYPLGYGYGGSTYRNLHGIPGLDLNNSIVVYFGQLSIIGAFLLMLGFILIMLFMVNNKIFKPTKTNSFYSRLSLICILGMIFVFCSDVLWFIPAIWLEFMLFCMLSKFNSSSSFEGIKNEKSCH